MPEVDVERKGLSLDYHLQGIIEEMLKNATRHLIDQRDYKVIVKDEEEEDEEYTETVTAKIEIQLVKASDTLLEKAKEED
jgi:6-pyruvoyl-tetrahydropterin synthase